jgi:hypothetical protein
MVMDPGLVDHLAPPLRRPCVPELRGSSLRLRRRPHGSLRCIRECHETRTAAVEMGQGSCTLADEVGHMLRDHDGRGVGIGPNHIGHHGRIHDAQPLESIDPTRSPIPTISRASLISMVLRPSSHGSRPHGAPAEDPSRLSPPRRSLPPRRHPLAPPLPKPSRAFRLTRGDAWSTDTASLRPCQGCTSRCLPVRPSCSHSRAGGHTHALPELWL